MGSEAIAGMIGFGVFFTMWVVIPAIVHKKRQANTEE
jgi:hypothetical protein